MPTTVSNPIINRSIKTAATCTCTCITHVNVIHFDVKRMLVWNDHQSFCILIHVHVIILSVHFCVHICIYIASLLSYSIIMIILTL